VLDDARSGLRELGDLVGDVLARTKPAGLSDERQPVELDDVLAEARVQLAAELAATDLVLSADPLPCVVGDRWSLQQVFVHVLQSALRRADGPLAIHVALSKRDGAWVITTNDDGQPIDPADLPRLFSLFGRPGDPDAVDAGLAIARRTVEEHGGAIWVEPAPGQGSAVCFSLPEAGP